MLKAKAAPAKKAAARPVKNGKAARKAVAAKAKKAGARARA